jgi:hypothetical protein
MRRILLSLVVLTAFAVHPAWSQTTISINPRATYLLTNQDPQALNAVPISLDALGIKAGESISIFVVGDFAYSDNPPWSDDIASEACGVFSANATLLPPNNLRRLPGAIAFPQTNAAPCASEPTLFGALSTDIPEDFRIDGQTIKVPNGAHYLFVAAADSYYGDNWDPDGDFGIQIQKALYTIPLQVLMRLIPWEGDRMTSIDPYEQSMFTSEGQLFYVGAAETEPGTVVLDRFQNGGDHRDSILTEVLGYSMEGPLGYAWTSNSLPGLSPMVEGFNIETDDYALMQPGEQLAGYTTEPLGVFGYKRFYNQNESLLSLTKGGVTVESNKVWGGMLWRWRWNEEQFINTHFWNGIQTFVFFDDGQGIRSMMEGFGSSTGSPIAVAKNEGATQKTRAIPLEENPQIDGQPSPMPFLWRDALVGKDLTLDFKGMGSVAKYTTVVSLPAPMPPASLYEPIMLLRALFNRFYTYRADTDELVQVTENMPDACTNDEYLETSPDFGGVIVSDDTGQYAFGVYGVNESAGGPLAVFQLRKVYCWQDGTSETSMDNTRIDAIRSGPIPAGESRFNLYLMTDTLENVRQKMRQLFLSGVK